MSTPGTTSTSGPTHSAPTPREAGHAMAETAKDEGRAVVDSAKQETARLASEARAELRKQGNEQVRRLGSSVRDVGRQLEGVERGEAPSGAVATVVHEAAGKANRLAARLDEGGLDAVTSDVKAFARQRPGLFLLGAFGLGIVAGRTLRNVDTHALVEAAKPSGEEPSPRTGEPFAGEYSTQTTEPVGAQIR